jgi:hypothetical protein
MLPRFSNPAGERLDDTAFGNNAVPALSQQSIKLAAKNF